MCDSAGTTEWESERVSVSTSDFVSPLLSLMGASLSMGPDTVFIACVCARVCVRMCVRVCVSF